MKKRLTTIAGLALVAGTLVFGTNASVGAAPAGCTGKELNKKVVGFGGSDISGGDTDFAPQLDGNGQITGYDITFNLLLASTSCTGVTYSATLYDPNDGTVIDTAAVPGDGLNTYVSVGPIFAPTDRLSSPSPGVTCVDASATTSNGAKTLDTAPDSGTATFCDPDLGVLRFR